jgi:hypothetical protein
MTFKPFKPSSSQMNLTDSAVVGSRAILELSIGCVVVVRSGQVSLSMSPKNPETRKMKHLSGVLLPWIGH